MRESIKNTLFRLHILQRSEFKPSTIDFLQQILYFDLIKNRMGNCPTRDGHPIILAPEKNRDEKKIGIANQRARNTGFSIKFIGKLVFPALSLAIAIFSNPVFFGV